jgi:hypothetical protein
MMVNCANPLAIEDEYVGAYVFMWWNFLNVHDKRAVKTSERSIFHRNLPYLTPAPTQ